MHWTWLKQILNAVPGKLLITSTCRPRFCCSTPTSSEAMIYTSSLWPSMDTRQYDKSGLKQTAWFAGRVHGVVVQIKANTDGLCSGIKWRMASGTLWVRSLTVTAVLLWVALYSSSASARAVLWTQLAVYKMLASFKTLSTPHSNIVHGETWGSRTKTKKGAIIVICGLYNSQDSYTSFLGTVPSKWNIAGISVVLTEVFNGFPHFLQANARTVPWLGHTYFYPIGVEQLGC